MLTATAHFLFALFLLISGYFLIFISSLLTLISKAVGDWRQPEAKLWQHLLSFFVCILIQIPIFYYLLVPVINYLLKFSSLAVDKELIVFILILYLFVDRLIGYLILKNKL